MEEADTPGDGPGPHGASGQDEEAASHDGGARVGGALAAGAQAGGAQADGADDDQYATSGKRQRPIEPAVNLASLMLAISDALHESDARPSGPADAPEQEEQGQGEREEDGCPRVGARGSLLGLLRTPSSLLAPSIVLPSDVPCAAVIAQPSVRLEAACIAVGAELLPPPAPPLAMLVECSAIAATEVELEAPCELAEADGGGADGGADGGDTDGGDTDSGASGGGANDGGSAPSEGASLPAPVSPCFDLDDEHGNTSREPHPL